MNDAPPAPKSHVPFEFERIFAVASIINVNGIVFPKPTPKQFARVPDELQPAPTQTVPTPVDEHPAPIRVLRSFDVEESEPTTTF